MRLSWHARMFVLIVSQGHVEKNANGKLAITRVDLHPNIAYGGTKQPTPADLDWLHDKAHRECFIANSVTTKISVVPTN